ncbi:MAG: hypothetical protein H6757_00455 [Candidatus Omnitrophica bacterium]|nr:hypothetical protein [Candidatus Omnitrophota bacterium]
MNQERKQFLIELLLPALTRFIGTQRWFRSKGKTLDVVAVEDCFLAEAGKDTDLYFILKISYKEKAEELYFFPCVLLSREKHDPPHKKKVETFEIGQSFFDCVEIIHHGAAFRRLLQRFSDETETVSDRGRFKFKCYGPSFKNGVEAARIVPLSAEQSNTSVKIDDRSILKIFRKMDEGVNPEVEVLKFLNQQKCSIVPMLQADMIYESSDKVMSAAVVQNFIPNLGDGWSYVLKSLPGLLGSPISEFKQTAFASEIRQLGETTATMHLEFSQAQEDDPQFGAEWINRDDLGRWAGDFKRLVKRAETDMESLKSSSLEGQPPHDLTGLLNKIFREADRIQQWETKDLFYKVRYHGDFHLGQTLKTDSGWVLFDFEGEPIRSIAERKQKGCVLKDVAGMLRSFDYAAFVACRNAASCRELTEEMNEKSTQIRRALRELFLEGYFSVQALEGRLYPQDKVLRSEWLGFFELEKAVYELIYEINNRPDWIEVPLQGIRDLYDPTESNR